jgi:hypothetical protein
VHAGRHANDHSHHTVHHPLTLSPLCPHRRAAAPAPYTQRASAGACYKLQARMQSSTLCTTVSPCPYFLKHLLQLLHSVLRRLQRVRVVACRVARRRPQEGLLVGVPAPAEGVWRCQGARHRWRWV